MTAHYTEHYQGHLAPIYVWMVGGSDAALQTGKTELDALNLSLSQGSLALDLGAGFGMHAIPLAQRGLRVTAIDTSAELLGTLNELRGTLPVRTVQADLLAFGTYLTETPSVILCMGDTMTHLPDLGAVDCLMEKVSSALRPGGMFVMTFRDYTVPLLAEQRFISVRSDDARILTCFLEYEPEMVVVHDILHERGSSGWQTRVSSYRKLRLEPAKIVASLQSHGFEVRREIGMRGMVRLVAQKAPGSGIKSSMPIKSNIQ